MDNMKIFSWSDHRHKGYEEYRQWKVFTELTLAFASVSNTRDLKKKTREAIQKNCQGKVIESV